ncbi:hypothetical protein LOTGIDRAFT_158345 [Lottia gigantea]|uniref:Uncharacterized protein n=1 Tax=Lottia gigantea TaxID=225164 RepID=V4B1D6_LOTGI|nr:hypothetical protein LOTGIDRAFT_158345 [Lottia gigantea]ESP00117.1 hypothetical protein LOTGIDRAFT_158345 [Lottia gigantea]
MWVRPIKPLHETHISTTPNQICVHSINVWNTLNRDTYRIVILASCITDVVYVRYFTGWRDKRLLQVCLLSLIGLSVISYILYQRFTMANLTFSTPLLQNTPDDVLQAYQEWLIQTKY